MNLCGKHVGTVLQNTRTHGETSTARVRIQLGGTAIFLMGVSDISAEHFFSIDIKDDSLAIENEEIEKKRRVKPVKLEMHFNKHAYIKGLAKIQQGVVGADVELIAIACPLAIVEVQKPPLRRKGIVGDIVLPESIDRRKGMNIE